jgi:hypothetical protein
VSRPDPSEAVQVDAEHPAIWMAEGSEVHSLMPRRLSGYATRIASGRLRIQGVGLGLEFRR